jgi:hypothetical protein
MHVEDEILVIALAGQVYDTGGFLKAPEKVRRR